MSSLKTNNISNLNGTLTIPTDTAIDLIENGTAKAWVNFNGTGTVAIRAAYNVTSITDNGAGDYTVNFTNAFSDANYAVIATGGYPSAAGALSINNTTAQTVSTVRLIHGHFVAAGGTGYPSDPTWANVAVFK